MMDKTNSQRLKKKVYMYACMNMEREGGRKGRRETKFGLPKSSLSLLHHQCVQAQGWVGEKTKVQGTMKQKVRML